MMTNGSTKTKVFAFETRGQMNKELGPINLLLQPKHAKQMAASTHTAKEWAQRTLTAKECACLLLVAPL